MLSELGTNCTLRTQITQITFSNELVLPSFAQSLGRWQALWLTHKAKYDKYDKHCVMDFSEADFDNEILLVSHNAGMPLMNLAPIFGSFLCFKVSRLPRLRHSLSQRFREGTFKNQAIESRDPLAHIHETLRHSSGIWPLYVYFFPCFRREFERKFERNETTIKCSQFSIARCEFKDLGKSWTPATHALKLTADRATETQNGPHDDHAALPTAIRCARLTSTSGGSHFGDLA